MRVFAYLDQMDGDFARLLLDDGETTVEWPAHLLPKDVLPGQWLSLTMIYDAKKQHEEEEIQRLQVERLRKRGTYEE